MFFTNLFYRKKLLFSIIMLLTGLAVSCFYWLLLSFQAMWVAGPWAIFWLVLIFVVIYFNLILLIPLVKLPSFILFTHWTGLGLLAILGLSSLIMFLISIWNLYFLGALLIVVSLLIALSKVSIFLMEKTITALEKGNLTPKKLGTKHSLKNMLTLKQLLLILIKN